MAVFLLSLLTCNVSNSQSSVPAATGGEVLRRVQLNRTVHHDYFEAATNPKVGHLLKLVEDFHLNQRVFSHFAGGRYHYVVGDLKYILDHFPNHPKALMFLTVVARLSNQRALPISYFEKALNLFPQHAITTAQYGSYLVDIGSIEPGIGKLEEAVKMDSKLTAGYAWLAKAYSKAGKLDLAREAAARAKELGFTGDLPTVNPGLTYNPNALVESSR